METKTVTDIYKKHAPLANIDVLVQKLHHVTNGKEDIFAVMIFDCDALDYVPVTKLFKDENTAIDYANKCAEE